jgi:phosphoribosylanthranilate isomerase
MRTRVKVCGLTRRQDAEFAVEIGVDAIGLVFYDASPRAVTIAQAKELISGLPPFVSIVGLFVDADVDFVKDCLSALPIDLLQFHGNESPEYCEQFERPYMKAIRMKEDVDLVEQAANYHSASALLLDTYQKGLPGGTGKAFDWSRVESITKPIVLAGGLTAENVSEAIRQVNPYAVDVSGGVEKAKGIKDFEKMSVFMQEVLNG